MFLQDVGAPSIKVTIGDSPAALGEIVVLQPGYCCALVLAISTIPTDFYQLGVTIGEAMLWYDETVHGPIMIEMTE